MQTQIDSIQAPIINREAKARLRLKEGKGIYLFRVKFNIYGTDYFDEKFIPVSQNADTINYQFKVQNENALDLTGI